MKELYNKKHSVLKKRSMFPSSHIGRSDIVKMALLLKLYIDLMQFPLNYQQHSGQI